MIARTGLSYMGVEIKPGSKIHISGWRSPLRYVSLYHQDGETFIECIHRDTTIYVPVDKFRRPAIKRSRSKND